MRHVGWASLSYRPTSSRHAPLPWRPAVCVAAAAHGLLVGSARQRLAAAGITRLLVTDSLPVEVQSIAALVADAVGRLHRDEDLADLLGQHVTS